jgi:hypothetical protein
VTSFAAPWWAQLLNDLVVGVVSGGLAFACVLAWKRKAR